MVKWDPRELRIYRGFFVLLNLILKGSCLGSEPSSFPPRFLLLAHPFILEENLSEFITKALFSQR